MALSRQRPKAHVVHRGLPLALGQGPPGCHLEMASAATAVTAACRLVRAGESPAERGVWCAWGASSMQDAQKRRALFGLASTKLTRYRPMLLSIDKRLTTHRQLWTEFDQIRRKRTWNRPNLARKQQSWMISTTRGAKLCQESENVGAIRPKSARFGPSSTNFGPESTNSDRCRSSLADFVAARTFADVRPNLVEVGRTRPKFIIQFQAEFARILGNFGRHWSKAARFCFFLTELG